MFVLKGSKFKSSHQQVIHKKDLFKKEKNVLPLNFNNIIYLTRNKSLAQLTFECTNNMMFVN